MSDRDDRPVIKVMEPCDCKGRWFQHEADCDTHIVAEYVCAEGLDGTLRVKPSDARAVREMHPGMTLVYLD